MVEEERLLAVDDEIEVAELLARYLARKGYPCEMATSGEEALSKMKEGKIALALIDIRMPGMNGIQLLKRMKEMDPDIAAVMVTAIKDRGSAVESMKLGADDYIVKPFELAEVAASVRRALEKRRLSLQVKEYQRDLEKKVEERTRELRRRSQELSLLYDVAVAAAESTRLDEILDCALDALDKHLKPDAIAILLVEPGTEELVIRAWRGFAGGPTLMRRPMGVGVPGWVVQTGKPVLLADVRQDERYHPCDPDTLSELCVPIRAGERVIGALNLESHRSGAFGEANMRLVSTLASNLATAVEKAGLYQEAVEERRKAETILEETFSGIMVVDPELRITAMNPGAGAIIGYTADEVLGRPLPEILRAEACGEGSLLSEAVATGQRVVPAEATIYGRLGVRDVLQGVTPLYDGEGKLYGYLLSFADITHLKEVDRLKSSIVANVSHEFRAPLASIKAYTELLLDELDEGDRATRHEFLSVIDHETDRLTALINNFLDLSRLEAGVEVKRGFLRLSEVVDDAISSLKVKVREKDIALQVDVPADLSLLADRELMGTLVKNLVSNAVKFSHQGGGVEVKGWEDESAVFLSVEDQGIGIPEEELPYIFERFRRVRSTTESGIEGTGLGLVLAKEAAEAHGGTIEVQSKLGEGSFFTVRLPKAANG